MSGQVASLLDALQQMSVNAELDRQRETLMIAAMLTGGEGSTLFGKPVRFRLEWPEGRPFGWTDEQLRQYGEEMQAKNAAFSQKNRQED